MTQRAQLREIGCSGGVERELPLVAQSKDGERGERLCDRADLEARVDVDRRIRSEVRDAVCPRPRELAIDDEPHREPRQLLRRAILREVRTELRIRRGQLRAPRRIRERRHRCRPLVEPLRRCVRGHRRASRRRRASARERRSGNETRETHRHGIPRSLRAPLRAKPARYSFNASAPPMISISSFVIAACRARL